MCANPNTTVFIEEFLLFLQMNEWRKVEYLSTTPLPGGKVEDGESDCDCLQRELLDSRAKRENCIAAEKKQ